MVMSLLTRPKKSVATVVVATDGTGDFNTNGTDDQVEINAALNSLPATGGCLYLKEGTYNITASIIIPYSNIAMMGCGKSTILNNLLPLAGSTIFADGLSGLIFTDFYLNEPVHVTLHRGLRIRNCNECFINRLWIENFQDGRAIWISGSDNIINNCFFLNNRFVIEDSDGVNLKLLITNNEFSGNGVVINGASINLQNFISSRIIVCNNYFEGNCNGIIPQTSSIILYGEGNVISNNVIKDNLGYGILLLNVSNDGYNNIITGNLIDGNLIDGIWLQCDVFETIISDNQIINNGGYGVGGTPAGMCQMTSNKATGNIFKNNTSGNFEDINIFDEIFDNLEL